MPRKFFKRYFPDHRSMREHRHLQLFGDLLHDPNLWHMNRRSVSGAMFIGLFTAFVPVPFQMVLSAAAAILWRKNLPISVGLVWITNPITMPPLFYFAYKLGAWILGSPVHRLHFELSFRWLLNELGAVWEPFLLGCFVLGTLSGLLGAGIVRAVWRLQVSSHLRHKKRQRALRERHTEN